MITLAGVVQGSTATATTAAAADKLDACTNYDKSGWCGARQRSNNNSNSSGKVRYLFKLI